MEGKVTFHSLVYLIYSDLLQNGSGKENLVIPIRLERRKVTIYLWKDIGGWIDAPCLPWLCDLYTPF